MALTQSEHSEPEGAEKKKVSVPPVLPLTTRVPMSCGCSALHVMLHLPLHRSKYDAI